MSARGGDQGHSQRTPRGHHNQDVGHRHGGGGGGGGGDGNHPPQRGNSRRRASPHHQMNDNDQDQAMLEAIGLGSTLTKQDEANVAHLRATLEGIG